ncbi:MAG: hypothetical protein CMJ29_02650 [Phycisphaerae bacterium]|nr:hypothetical protein [Phycisphaerae bacterium]|tara:strand:- start:843 stop:1712 length:870 start_codon:yes stop_codon:yes gene_type:complete
MRKFGKISAIVACSLLALIIILYLSVDLIARYALHRAGTDLMGVETTASSVDLGIIRNSTTITDLTIDNPEGFRQPRLLEVKNMYIEGRLGTFVSSNIQIPLVSLDGFTIDLEQIGDRINVSEVVSNISKEVDEPDDSGGDITLNIARLEIKDITLTAEGKIVSIAGGKLDATLPKIELADVGTESDPDKLLAHVIGIMVKIVLNHIASNPIKGLSNAALGQIGNAIESIPGLKQVGLGKPIADAVRGVGEGAAGAINGIGDVIRGATGGKAKSDGSSKGAAGSDEQQP